MNPAKALRELGDFEGRWRLYKSITQQGGGAEARFEGMAVWSAVAAGLAYHETGQLHLAGAAPIRAERRYLWCAPLRVCFEDGRFFHDVPAAGGSALHHCAPDLYRVRYNFDTWPDWTATWHVTGPRKDYRIEMRFTRAGG